MKLFAFKYLVLASLAALVWSEPEPDPDQASRYRATQYFKDDVKEADDVLYKSNKKEKLIDSFKKANTTSSGRFFMRRFFFNKMFGHKQQIIPIIITGLNTDPDVDMDTDTKTNIDTVTDDTPTDTIATTAEEPATDTTDTSTPTTADNEANPVNPDGRIQLYGRRSADENEKEFDEDATAVNGENMAAALSAGPKEYVVTDEEIKGTSRAKSNRAQTRINLRIRGAKPGQIIRLSIPAKYSRYFQNGQRVYLNNKSRRRIMRRRKNRRRPNKNKNKRRRIAAA